MVKIAFCVATFTVLTKTLTNSSFRLFHLLHIASPRRQLNYEYRLCGSVSFSCLLDCNCWSVLQQQQPISLFPQDINVV